MASRSSRSLPQSGYKVMRGNGFSKVNPYVTSNPFGILVDEGLNNVQDDLNCKSTASVSRSGRSNTSFLLQSESPHLLSM